VHPHIKAKNAKYFGYKKGLRQLPKSLIFGAGNGIRTRDLQLGKNTFRRFSIFQIASKHLT
jgi:hypothetical protein